MRTPEKLDARSLELHRLIAKKVRSDPELLGRASKTLTRWRAVVDTNTQPYLRRWEQLIEAGLEPALEMATSDSEEAKALRQASPFCGILSPKERAEFLKSWRWE